MKTSVVMLACDINDKLSDLSRKTIESLKQTDGEFEFVIADNNSTYSSHLRGVSDIYVRNNKNTGYTGGTNQGVKLSHGDFIAIANNDIRVSSNWLKVAEEIFKNPKVGTVHFRMISYDEPFSFGGETWETGKERWCHCSFFVIRREAFGDGYDESYKEGGYDDWDFCHRKRHLEGWLTAYTNKACFQHMDSSTYMALDDGHNRNERDIRNREHFKSKFGAYAEDIWNEKYPDQMKQSWRPFP